MDSFSYVQILLRYRPRSEKEVRERLALKGYESKVISETVEKLKRSDLIDDFEFAKYWLSYRLSYSLRSKSYAVFELKVKGVSEEIIDKAFKEFEAVDEKDIIFKLAEKKAKSMSRIKDRNTKLRRLYAYLGRRGFNSLVSRDAVEEALNS